jgi:predicted ribonuclease YlaK
MIDDMASTLLTVNSTPNTFDKDYIIKMAHKLSQIYPRVILVSKDLSTRIKADALGVSVQDYLAGKVNTTNMFRGFEQIELETPIFAKVSESVERKSSSLAKLSVVRTTDTENPEDTPKTDQSVASKEDELLKTLLQKELMPNEFLIVVDKNEAKSKFVGNISILKPTLKYETKKYQII